MSKKLKERNQVLYKVVGRVTPIQKNVAMFFEYKNRIKQTYLGVLIIADSSLF